MAYSEDLTKLNAYLHLNVGRTASGTVREKKISMGALSKDSWDADKALNIVDALAPIFTHDLYRVTNAKEYDMSRD